jgi:ABC-type glycerol-3-phosphate transport system substrate-binding protein
MPLASVLVASCGVSQLVPWGAPSPTPVVDRIVRVATTNKASGVWAGAQVSAAARRLPLERHLSFDVRAFNPATAGVPLAVSNAFAVWPSVFATQVGLLPGDSAVDLVLVDSRWISACGKADVLLDLAPILRGERWFDAKTYPGEVLAAGRARGRQLALPLGLHADALLYDDRAFRADRVHPPRADWLWPELVAAARSLTRRERFGLALVRDAPSPSLWTLLWQRGTSAIRDEGSAMDFAEPGMVDALRFLGDLVHRHAVARSPDPDPPTLLATMAQRDAAMAGVYAGQPVFWRQSRFEGFALTTWPTGERASDLGGVHAYAPLMIGIPRNAPRRDLAIEALGALAGAVPEGVPLPAGQRTVGTAIERSDLLSAEEVAALARMRAAARFLPGDFAYFAVSQLIEDELVAPVLAGRKRPEQAIADARPALEARLREFARPA